jgi:AcrR family transcriptional regulator
MSRIEPVPEPTVVTPRSRKGELTRSRLLDAAKTVFEETGFLEARISDIAVSAGLSHGSFYHYFESKEQIFREVAEAQEALLTAPTNHSEPDGGQPTELDRIRLANRFYLQRYRDNGKIMGVIEEVSRYDTYVNEARMRRQKHFADRAERSILRLQAQGAADPDVDAEIAAVALGSMIGRFAELWLVEEWAEFEFEAAVDQITRLWANAIGLREATSGAPTKRVPVKKAAAKKAAVKKSTSKKAPARKSAAKR